MSKKIATYDELMQRKFRLENLLETQKQLLQLDIAEIKAELEPLMDMACSATEFLTRNKKAWLLGSGANALVDFLIKDVLLSKSGWMAKTIVPFFIKNYTSHFIASHQEEWIKNIGEWMSNGNGAEKEAEA